MTRVYVKNMGGAPTVIDALTSDDFTGTEFYQRSSWTPVLTFTTPGDLNVVYSAQSGTYFKIGNLVVALANIGTSTFTHTTASGNLEITGVPFANAAAAFRVSGPVTWAGITKAGYTDIGTTMAGSVTTINFRASGSGVGNDNVHAADMPTGGSVVLRFIHIYETD